MQEHTQEEIQTLIDEAVKEFGVTPKREGTPRLLAHMDGRLIGVTTATRCLGVWPPVAFTSALYDKVVCTTDKVPDNLAAERFRAAVRGLNAAIKALIESEGDAINERDEIHFGVALTYESGIEIVAMKAMGGVGDFHTAESTYALPDETDPTLIPLSEARRLMLEGAIT